MRLKGILWGTTIQTKLMVSIGLVLVTLFLFIRPSDGITVETDLIANDRALFITADQGNGFQSISTPFSGQEIHDLLRDEVQVQRFYAATGAGLYVSEDCGQTWSEMEVRLSDPTLQAADHHKTVLAVARAQDRLFVGTLNGLFVSQDDGRSWSQMSNGIPLILMGKLIPKEIPALKSTIVLTEVTVWYGKKILPHHDSQ